MEKQSETKKEKYSKLHQEEVGNVVTIPPNKTATMDKIEMFPNEKIIAAPLVAEHSNCLYSLSQLFCFWHKPEAHLVNNSEVYRSTTEPHY